MSQNITLIKDKILSDNYFTLRNITYDLTRRNGEVIRHKREVYDRGNGATILLYNSTKKTVVLVRQFRVATWVNGNEDGMLIETCAGLLDNDEPEVCIRKEAIEETGYDVGEVRKIFELYMSPGGVTELIHFFIAEYRDSERASTGAVWRTKISKCLNCRFPGRWKWRARERFGTVRRCYCLTIYICLI
ncbi:GDP-mannose pyrophosphatase nudK [Salmonella enterica subsp. arizonae]|nr:GDP-mannose pyrophosphatase nudK [Salmonella enterica subsp. arizonae]